MRKNSAAAAALAALAAAFSISTAQADQQSLAQAILATSPTYLYQLNDAPGSTTAADSSAIGRRSLQLEDANAEGRTGSGVTFDGTDATLGGAQYLGNGPQIRMRSPKAFSLSVWFEAPADFPGGVRDLVDAQHWRLQIGATTVGTGSPLHVNFVDRGPQSDGVIGRSASVNVATGKHQLVAVGSGHTMTLYLDGRVVLTMPIVKIERGRLSVGSLPGSAGFNTGVGQVWDVAGWKRALTSTEVSSMWSAGL